LVFDPKVLLLDEPLSALDKNLRDYMKGELKSLHRRVGVTIIYVTHDQSEALAMSDRIAVLRHGVLIDLDQPARLYSLPSSRYVAAFIGDANFLDAEIMAADVASVTINSQLGTWRVPRERVRTRDGATRPGLPVTVVVRPENIIVSPPQPVSPGLLLVPCDVTETLYNGSHTAYSLCARESKIPLRARDGGELGHPAKGGGTTTVGIFVERSVVVDRAS
jgi:ABC-type Fe3+/spermidine/putrescine transport system ATPase subunit